MIGNLLYLTAGTLVGALVVRVASRQRPRELCSYCGEKAVDGLSGWCWHCHGLGRCNDCELAALEVRATVSGFERHCTMFHLPAERVREEERSGRRFQAVSRQRVSGVERAGLSSETNGRPNVAPRSTPSVPKLLRCARRGRGGRMPGENHGTHAGPSSRPTNVWRNHGERTGHHGSRLGTKQAARKAAPRAGMRASLPSAVATVVTLPFVALSRWAKWPG